MISTISITDMVKFQISVPPHIQGYIHTPTTWIGTLSCHRTSICTPYVHDPCNFHHPRYGKHLKHWALYIQGCTQSRYSDLLKPHMFAFMHIYIQIYIYVYENRQLSVDISIEAHLIPHNLH